MKNNTCKLCAENCGRRRICLEHKEAYPYVASAKGGLPFDRSKLMNKNKKVKRATMTSPEDIFREVSING